LANEEIYKKIQARKFFGVAGVEERKLQILAMIDDFKKNEEIDEEEVKEIRKQVAQEIIDYNKKIEHKDYDEDDIEELDEDLEALKNIPDLIDEQERRKIDALIAKLYTVCRNEVSLASKLYKELNKFQQAKEKVEAGGSNLSQQTISQAKIFDEYKKSKGAAIPTAGSSLLTSCFGGYEDISSFEFALTHLEFIIGEAPTYYTALGLEVGADFDKVQAAYDDLAPK